MDPIVNILLPTFEPDPAHLREAIESVLNQTETRWTLFIHDDASSADTASMVQPYLSDPRITFARGRRRHGIGRNWNATLRGEDIRDDRTRSLHTSAPFVQYIFQDDRWVLTYLERACAVLAEYRDVGCVSVQHVYVFENDSAMRDHYEHLMRLRRTGLAAGKHDGLAFVLWWLKQGLRPNIVGEPSFMLMRRSLVAETGWFREDMPQLLDVEYWVRALPRTTWYNLAETLGSFRVHTSGASERNRAQGVGVFDRLQCLSSALRSVPAGREKARAQRAVAASLQSMILEFRTLKRSDGSPARGKGRVLHFGFRHPFLALRALRGASRQTKNSAK